MKRRGILIGSLIALGIILVSLFYLFSPGTPSRDNFFSYLPAQMLDEGGGVFYTNYSQLHSLTPSLESLSFSEFYPQISSLDLGCSLNQLFFMPDFAQELKLDWRALKECAWVPSSPLEVIRSDLDFEEVFLRLEEEGYSQRESDGTIFLDGQFNPSSSLAIFGQLAQIKDLLIMERFTPLEEYSINRETVLKTISGTQPSLLESAVWKEYSKFLESAPSFYLGQAPSLTSLEDILPLNPNLSQENQAELAAERRGALLGPDFLDFCVLSDLKDKGSVTFLLRYKEESSAGSDMAKLEKALNVSYSSVFKGENFQTLLGNPQVSAEGKFLKVIGHPQIGIKIILAMVQNGDFGFLFKLSGE